MSAWKVIVDAFRKNGSCDVEGSDGVAAIHSLTAADYRILAPEENEALSELVGWLQNEVDADPDLTPGLAVLRRALAKGGGDG